MLPAWKVLPCQTRGLLVVIHVITNCSNFGMSVLGRERPAAISIEIKSIDDTSNFDEFPESDILKPTGNILPLLPAAYKCITFPELWGDVYKSG